MAVGYAVAAAVASVAYSALFLLFGTITRHAVVFGLVYALIWETFVGTLIPGAKTLSIQQWALAVGQKAAAEGALSSDVQLPLALCLLVGLTGVATWYASRRLKALTLAGEE